MRDAAAIDVANGPRPRASFRARAKLLARHHAVGVACLLLIAGLVTMALAADLIAPYSPTAQDSAPLEDPSWDHWFGTDRLGRDVLSRTIYGARVSLPVAAAAVAGGTAIGVWLGLTSGYFGGLADRLVQVLNDVLIAFPGIVALLAITAAVGASLTVVTVAIGALVVPAVMRVVRGSVLREKETLYVEAARATGAGSLRILLRHILPNVSGTAIVLAAQMIPIAVLTEAALSFLGFGARPPTASWGGDLSGDAQLYFTLQPWMAIAPGIALTITVAAFSFMGDWLRDVLDPRTRIAI